MEKAAKIYKKLFSSDFGALKSAHNLAQTTAFGKSRIFAQMKKYGKTREFGRLFQKKVKHY
jgi:hypothetical protein